LFAELEIESIGKEKVQLQEILKQQQQKDIDVSKLNSERSSLEAQLASFAQQRYNTTTKKKERFLLRIVFFFFLSF
jgi:hypothetical protein